MRGQISRLAYGSLEMTGGRLAFGVNDYGNRCLFCQSRYVIYNTLQPVLMLLCEVAMLLRYEARDTRLIKNLSASGRFMLQLL